MVKIFPDFKQGFEYRREGWEYGLGKQSIFVEDIENCPPTIEIEASDEKSLGILFQKLGVKKAIRDSVPNMVAQKIKYSLTTPTRIPAPIINLIQFLYIWIQI